MLARRRLFHATDLPHEPPSGDGSSSDTPPGDAEMHLGRALRHRFSNLVRQQHQPTEDELLVQTFREAWCFETKLNILRYNPAMFRRYQAYAVRSRHFSPTGLCHVLLDFMGECMKIPEILEDIRREGEQSRYAAYVVSALDESDTETITFESPGAESAERDIRTSFAIPEDGPLIPMECSLFSSSPFSAMSTPSAASVASTPDVQSTTGKQDDADDRSCVSMGTFKTGYSLPSLAGTEAPSDDSSIDSTGQSPHGRVALRARMVPFATRPRPLLR